MIIINNNNNNNNDNDNNNNNNNKNSNNNIFHSLGFILNQFVRHVFIALLIYHLKLMATKLTEVNKFCFERFEIKLLFDMALPFICCT